jgi:hypothetical protein
MTTLTENPACLQVDTVAGLAPVLPVVGHGTLAPLVDGRRVPYANLDVAASAPALQAVADRVTATLPLYASVHRGAGYLSQVSTALYEQSRRTIGEFATPPTRSTCWPVASRRPTTARRVACSSSTSSTTRTSCPGSARPTPPS